jgi:hypothetical protein
MVRFRICYRLASNREFRPSLASVWVNEVASDANSRTALVLGFLYPGQGHLLSDLAIYTSVLSTAPGHLWFKTVKINQYKQIWKQKQQN